MKRILFFLIALFVVNPPDCVRAGGRSRENVTVTAAVRTGNVQNNTTKAIKAEVGTASWYGPGFHGRKTSNGEIYNQWQLTAAHPTLPFDAEVVVTVMETGKSVRVRINDRGPFVAGRKIDLSTKAAETIGMIKKGTATVSIKVVYLPST